MKAIELLFSSFFGFRILESCLILWGIFEESGIVIWIDCLATAFRNMIVSKFGTNPLREAFLAVQIIATGQGWHQL